VSVEYRGGMKFRTSVRGHYIDVDLPDDKGGEDSGPTPTELCISSLGTCVGVYAIHYLKTAKFDTEGFSVDVDWEYSEDKKRIGDITITVSAPKADLGPRKKALMAAMEKCLIHNTLKQAPEIKMEISGEWEA